MPEGAGDPVPSPVLGGRREAREQALLLLYEAEIRSLGAEAMVADVVVEPDEYTAEVLAGVEANQERLDQLLGERTGDWPIHRLGAIDRAVLRLAVWELRQRRAGHARRRRSIRRHGPRLGPARRWLNANGAWPGPTGARFIPACG